ncbi:splicing factor 3B subunit 5-like [Leptodactylus fuscus]|uniref:splicing factor 3B subunit 5-like n=1 Tax=Leptodactylus fuscus TaxID=238119 RepID=UPI003F4EAD12
MTDRYTIHSQLEHLQSKCIGTGHADTTKWEWLVNQHRDSYCSYMGHLMYRGLSGAQFFFLILPKLLLKGRQGTLNSSSK